MDIFSRRRLFVDQRVERGPEPARALLPGGYDLVARGPGDGLAEAGVVEEVVVGPVVEG